LDHVEEVEGVTFPATGKPAIILKPGKQPLDFPTAQVTAKRHDVSPKNPTQDLRFFHDLSTIYAAHRDLLSR
jgi:hypothetical protein